MLQGFTPGLRQQGRMVEFAPVILLLSHLTAHGDTWQGLRDLLQVSNCSDLQPASQLHSGLKEP